jgi:hypothetical protein
MENVAEKPILSPKGTFPATVVKVIDDYKLVMNRGKQNGIREGQRMMVYSNSWSYEVQWKANRQIIELTRFL